MAVAALPLGWPTVLRAVIAGPGVWATPAELLDRLPELVESHGGRWKAFKALRERCEEMIAAGWLEGASVGPDAVVMLSVEAGEKLGVRISDDEPARWEGYDARRLPRVSYHDFSADERSVYYEVPDTAPGPEEEAIAREATEPPFRRTHGTWIWPWRRCDCSIECSRVALPKQCYCLICGRPYWENAA